MPAISMTLSILKSGLSKDEREGNSQHLQKHFKYIGSNCISQIQRFQGILKLFEFLHGADGMYVFAGVYNNNYS